MNDYHSLVATKGVMDHAHGFVVEELNPAMFPFQKAIVKWALQKGRSAIFADTGLGKTLMELEWAKHIHARTQKTYLNICAFSRSASNS